MSIRAFFIFRNGIIHFCVNDITFLKFPVMYQKALFQNFESMIG